MDIRSRLPELKELLRAGANKAECFEIMFSFAIEKIYQYHFIEMRDV